MRYRPLLPRSSSAPTTFGRHRLRSLAASRRWLMMRIRALEAHLCLLEAQRQAALAHMALRSTTSQESPPKSPIVFDAPSFEATLSYRPTDRESPMS